MILSVPVAMRGSFDRNKKFYPDRTGPGFDLEYDFVPLKGTLTRFIVVRADSEIGRHVEGLLKMGEEMR